MDEIDRKIAIAVQQDGAAGLAELAKIAGLSVSATAERQKRLEERGVIIGWHARLDPTEAGCPFDCGLCPDHEQHSCLAIVEINAACNLGRPISLSVPPWLRMRRCWNATM